MKKLILTASFTAISALSSAQDFQGVPGILKAIAEKSGKPAEKEADPVDELKLKVKKLREEARTLAPAEAAKRWVELLETWLAIPQAQIYSSGSYEDRPNLGMLLTALPSPAAWDGIAAQLAQRKTDNALQDSFLRLLIAVLRRDAAARDQALEGIRLQLKATKGLDGYQRKMYEQNLVQITTALKELAGTDAERISAFEASLEQMEKGDVQSPLGRGSRRIEVPDLVRFTDEKKATVLLTRLLKAGPESLQIQGKATRLLAATLALKHIDTLKKPLWQLVTTLDHAPLFEAMAAKFPESDYNERQGATEIYLLSLIANERTQDAVKLATEEEGGRDGHVSIVVGHLDAMNRQGLGKQVFAFLHQLLIKDATLPYWPQFIELAAHQNASADALKLLQDSLVKAGLKPDTRATMQSYYYVALLAADQRDEGVRVLQELVKGGPSKRKSKHTAWSTFDSSLSDHLEICTTLATLGRLLNKPPLIDEAVTAAVAAFENAPKSDSDRGSELQSLVRLLLAHGRALQAEQVLTKRLVHTVTQEKPQNSYSNADRADDILMHLASVYDHTGRYKDALEVFDRMPYWSIPDLAYLESSNTDGVLLLVLAARALVENGRKEEAARVLRRAAQNNPGEDSVYELLLRVEAGQPLLDFLDQMAKRDRFEERPLIWKARVLLDSGKVDDAEKAVRAAIAIDPSDGEQGKGDRMRAYAVLAEVLDKKGDAETAKVMRGAVSAIRKSEDADDWWSAGLLSEAVRRYEAALLDFADAYCIQSRLALRYSDLGEFDKAEKHYLRAFELMPDSFGRVESHCFGCEGAFSGTRAQNIADKVFTRLANHPPVKAQVYYLLGYLRSAQDRDTEAAEAYRQAVKTDPDYLNAWAKLSGLAETAQMPREESENAMMQIFRLDPASRHSHARLEDMRDIPKLWTTLLAAEASLPVKESGPLLPLSAAAAKHQAQKGKQASWESETQLSYASRQEDPRNHLLQNRLVSILMQFIENARSR